MDLRKYFKAKDVEKVETEDADDSDEKETEQGKVACKYGSNCYQKNPYHLARFSHPKRSSEEARESSNKKPKLSHSHELESWSNDEDNASGENINEMSPPEDFHNISDSSENDLNLPKDYMIEYSEPLISIDVIIGDDRSKMKELFVVEFPEDFFNFFQFCKSLNSESPDAALKDVGLELVGPYDFLSGRMRPSTRSQIIRHFRFYYDPPELFTVLKCSGSQLHYGYYFDDPAQVSSLVVSNDPSENCIIKIVGPNIFSVVSAYINTYIKTCDPFIKIKIQKVQTLLSKWIKENEINIDPNSLSVRQRNSKVNSKTFHGAGIIVPYDKKTNVGYRPLAENDKTLKDLLKKIAESETEEERNIHWNKIEHVINFATIAADECDFGTSLELGIDLFCQGHECFHRTAQRLMTTAYNLLGRNYFADIIKIHLKNRVKGSNLNFASIE